MQFQYPEDRDFFVNFLAGGDEDLFNKEFADYFDFRDPKIKRGEFNRIRNKVFQELVRKHGKKCQLRIHPDCGKNGKFDVDHFIPLSTNELNKRLRHIKRTAHRKVPAQSFGSNNIKNLLIACSRCNAYKKHRILKVGHVAS
jgi:5-methylcytosine-specific restriction endonuclease McrA